MNQRREALADINVEEVFTFLSERISTKTVSKSETLFWRRGMACTYQCCCCNLWKVWTK